MGPALPDRSVGILTDTHMSDVRLVSSDRAVHQSDEGIPVGPALRPTQRSQGAEHTVLSRTITDERRRGLVAEPAGRNIREWRATYRATDDRYASETAYLEVLP